MAFSVISTMEGSVEALRFSSYFKSLGSKRPGEGGRCGVCPCWGCFVSPPAIPERGGGGGIASGAGSNALTHQVAHRVILHRVQALLVPDIAGALPARTEPVPTARTPCPASHPLHPGTVPSWHSAIWQSSQGRPSWCHSELGPVGTRGLGSTWGSCTSARRPGSPAGELSRPSQCSWSPLPPKPAPQLTLISVLCTSW